MKVKSALRDRYMMRHTLHSGLELAWRDRLRHDAGSATSREPLKREAFLSGDQAAILARAKAVRHLTGNEATRPA